MQDSTAKTPTTIYRLDHAYLLPGHQDGRDRLIRELHGQAHLAVVVAGHYEYDTFVVDDWLVVDSFDDPDEDGYWFGGANGEVDGWGATKSDAAVRAFLEMDRRYPDADSREP